MKWLSILCLFFCSVNLHADETSWPDDMIWWDDTWWTTNQQCCEVDPGLSEEEELVQYYAKEIAIRTQEQLEADPELFFRHGCARLDMINLLDTVEDVLNLLSEVQKDFQFVVDHAGYDVRMYAAAQHKVNVIDAILQASPETEDEIGEVILAYNEQSLKDLTGSLADGDEFTEELFFSVLENEQIADMFYLYVMLSSNDPDIALEYVHPHEMELIGIVPHKEMRSTLLCRIEYSDYYSSFTLDQEI